MIKTGHAILAIAFLGLLLPGIAIAKKCEPPPCRGSDPPGNPETSLYDVVSTPALVNGVDWLDGKGRDEISYKYFFYDDDRGFIDNSFIDDLQVFFSPDGDDCFPDDFKPVPLYQGDIFKAKKGSAKGMFWFDAYAIDGTTVVLYMLEVFGMFEDAPWPPPPDGSHTVTMTKWSLSVNQSDSASCVAEGIPFPGDGVDITVSSYTE
jgi:hypothetical protein